MMYPPSLSDDLKARAFRASNGELGILPADAPSFLAACRSDNVEVLGWELWVIDHQWGVEPNSPVPAKGSWCGGIPMQGSDVPAVVCGEGDVDETERQLGSVDLDVEVMPAWLPQVRVNFTLDG
jgi:hypothetical protein